MTEIKKVFDLNSMIPRDQHLQLIDLGFKFTPSENAYHKHNTTITIKNKEIYLLIGFNPTNQRKVTDFNTLLSTISKKVS